MCGIAGIINLEQTQNSKEHLLTRMLSRINHRGPDESGIYLDNVAGLGSVRLSIIDLATGQQPMHTPDYKYWIVFNGEIFNYEELQKDLRIKGYQFKTTSDTEVLLYLFEEYGEKCLDKLNGQFVFAIWNSHKKELFIARDRVGIRPLFYYFKNGVFVFASEIKSILEYEDYTPEIDPKAFSQIFTFWNCISPNTILKNIEELSPGHYLKFKNNTIDIHKYWQISFGALKKTYSLDDLIQEFEDILTDATRLRLKADVNVAAYLSGGLDSSTITALIKSISPSQFKTFSIGFSDNDFDETPFQKNVSDFLKTEHYSFQCNSKDISDVFPSVIWHTETPLLRTAPAPLFLLSQKVREQNIKVVLTGEGADEFLNGYDIFKETLIRHFWAKQPHSKFRPLLLKSLYPYIPQISGMSGQALKFLFGYRLTEVDDPFYSHQLRWHNTMSLQRYFSFELMDQLEEYNPIKNLTDKLPLEFYMYDAVEKAQWIESSIFLPGYLLSSQGDRMSMANSVEGRYPFLDYRLIEFCNSLPSNIKLKGLNEKYLLKKLMKGRLPECVLSRPKQSYRAPIIQSFINNPPEYLKSLLSKEAFLHNNLFDYEKVKPLFKKLNEGNLYSETDTMAVTGIISSHLFSEIFIKENKYFKPSLNLLHPRIIYQPTKQIAYEYIS